MSNTLNNYFSVVQPKRKLEEIDHNVDNSNAHVNDEINSVVTDKVHPVSILFQNMICFIMLILFYDYSNFKCFNI
jgi:hypothetical protein